LLTITALNKYRPNLTARALGISEKRLQEIRHKFEVGDKGKRAAGVTLGGDGRVFLGDLAFYQAGPFTQMIFYDQDLPGHIVHEFFHRESWS
jgi:hypothetical protein